MKTQMTFLLTTLLSLCLVFALAWYYSFYKKVFAWLDFFWSISFLLVITLFHIHQYQNTGSTHLRLIDMLFVIWSLRLSSHLFKRIKRHGEDKRYTNLKRKWKVWYGVNFYFLYQAEALLTLTLSIPLLLTYSSTHPLQYFAATLFCVSISGETIADKQLASFIKNNDDKTKVCNIGLWKYSRHPNYFFEWLSWVAFAFYGFSSVEKWPALIPPIIMYILLTKVTGIPPAEASSEQSKRENYMQYQKKTNAFFPWFPKKAFITIMLLFFFNQQLFAQGGAVNQQEKIKYFFDNLRSDNMKIVYDFYDKDAIFIDPIGSHKGAESLKKYYENMYKNVKLIKFNYNEIVTNGNTHVLLWKMTFATDGFNSGEPITAEGNSHIKFNDTGKVIYHRDYFDMGEFIYEHVPVLGWTIKKVKNKLKAE